MRLRLFVPVALLAMFFAAGCAKKADDAAIVTNIKAQMFSESQLKGANLQVASSRGEVTLSGAVPSDAARLDAYKIATQTPGVTKVNDQMTVDTSLAAQTTPADQAAPEQPAQTQPSAEPVAENAPAAAPAPKKPEHHRSNRPAKNNAEAASPDQAQPTESSQQPGPATPPPQIPVQSVPAPQPVIANPAPPPPPPPRQVEVPSGSTMTIRMIDDVDSSVNKPGEIFHASLDAPVIIGNDVVVPSGADVYVRLASSSNSGRMTGTSELHLELVKLEFQGQSYPLVSSTYSVSGSSRGKDTAKKVGAGAVLGTLIGAIAGGGKGAAIGAAAGAGAGGAYQAATRGKHVKVPSETKLDFQLEQPVTVTVMPHSATLAQ
jgi:BON domain